MINGQLTGYGGVYHAPPGEEYWDGDTLDASVRASKIGRMLIESLMKKQVPFAEQVPTKPTEENRVYREQFEPNYRQEARKRFMPFQSLNTNFDIPNTFERSPKSNEGFANFDREPLYPGGDNRYQYFQESDDVYQTQNQAPRPIFNRNIEYSSPLPFHRPENANIIHSHRSHRISHGNGVYSNVEVYRQFRSLYPNFN